MNFGVSLNLVNKCAPYSLKISVTHQIGWSSEATLQDELTGCHMVLLWCCVQWMSCFNQTKPLIPIPFQSILYRTKFTLLFCRSLYSVLLLTLQSSLSERMAHRRIQGSNPAGGSTLSCPLAGPSCSGRGWQSCAGTRDMWWLFWTMPWTPPSGSEKATLRMESFNLTILTSLSDSNRIWSYSERATKKMMEVTFSKQWIHFRRSDLCPPTSTIL